MPYFKKEKRLSHEGHLLYKYTADASHHHAAHGPPPFKGRTWGAVLYTYKI